MEMIGVDLFAGAGGMSLGAEAAGIDVRLAIERDPHCVDTYEYNHKNTLVIKEDIINIQDVDVPKGSNGTILFGGPPCQGFSTSNQRTRGDGNLGNWLFIQFMRLADEWRPDWVVFENVEGILHTSNGTFFKSVKLMLENSDYTVSYWVLNAQDYGVPQRRQRLFIIGSLEGIQVSPPPKRKAKAVTVKESIADLPFLENGANISLLPYTCAPSSEYAKKMRGKLTRCHNNIVTRNNDNVIERYQHVPAGGNWQDIPAVLMDNYKNRDRCHTRIYHRLRSNEPSVVIGNFRKNMLIHPSQHRGLSVREAARLQSFPDNYQFKGSIGFQQQQVGNAVPPLLARAVFKQILNAKSSGR